MLGSSWGLGLGGVWVGGQSRGGLSWLQQSFLLPMPGSAWQPSPPPAFPLLQAIRPLFWGTVLSAIGSNQRRSDTGPAAPLRAQKLVLGWLMVGVFFFFFQTTLS